MANIEKKKPVFSCILRINTCETMIHVKTSCINISKINEKLNYSKSQYCIALTQPCCGEGKKKKNSLLNFGNVLHTGDQRGSLDLQNT